MAGSPQRQQLKGPKRRTRLGGGIITRLIPNREGATAVEFAFTLPIAMFMLSGIVQFGAMMFLQNNMTNVARDVARRVSVGELNKPQGEQAARDALMDWGINYTVTVTLPDPLNPADVDVVVEISAPMSDASPIDLLGLFDSQTMRANVTMREEPAAS